MKIAKIRTGILSVPLRTPFKTALRTVSRVEDVIVEITADTGEVGYGEAPPTGAVTGETKGSILGAIRDHIGPALLGREMDGLWELMGVLDSSIVKNTSAKAAADMALWDLYGQFCGLPVYRLLGGKRKRLETDLTISVNAPEQMAEDAAEAVSRGYDCLKVKVGIDPSLDVERLAAVQEAAGKKTRLRIDANQAWLPKEAVRLLEQMRQKELNIEFVEQPVKAADLSGLKYVTDRSPYPILADESVFSPQDAVRIMELRAADLVNIKLMKCGGIGQALKIASAAEIYGVECMIGCMLESKLSVNAAVHLACARSIITKVDLDGPGLCLTDPVLGGAVFEGKNITASDGPGLGIEGIEGVLWLENGV